MLDTGILAFTTFFAAIAPLDVAVRFAALAAQIILDGVAESGCPGS